MLVFRTGEWSLGWFPVREVVGTRVGIFVGFFVGNLVGDSEVIEAGNMVGLIVGMSAGGGPGILVGDRAGGMNERTEGDTVLLCAPRESPQCSCMCDQIYISSRPQRPTLANSGQKRISSVYAVG